MKKNVFGSTLCALLLALCVSARAQQPGGKVSRIGYLTIFETKSAEAKQRLDGFVQGLQDVGYVVGKNISIEQRSAEGNEKQLLPLAEELVRLKVDVIVVPNDTTARPAKQATTTIPIVMMASADPVRRRLIASLARPGGNVTGLTSYTAELLGKRLALLKEAVPKLSLFAFLLDATPTRVSASAEAFKEAQPTAKSLGVTLRTLEVDRSKPDFNQAFRIVAKERIEAVITAPGPILTVHQKQILELIGQHRVPAMHSTPRWVDAGGLMSYGVSTMDRFSRAAVYVDKILKGANPAELPVEGPTKFDFVINLKTAKQLGLEIPQSVLFRADRVIR